MKNILLLHGALGSAEDLKHLSESLKNRGLNTYSFSFSGHAKTPFKGKFGVEIFTEELSTYIQEKKLTNLAVFGYSMGGYVALNLAHRQKNLIEKIITLGTKFNWSEEVVEKETRMLNPEKMLEKVPTFAKALETKHGAQWKELVVKTADLMHEIAQKKYLTTKNLKTIETPTLLGLADRDHMVSLDETSQVFKEIPNSFMYVLPGSKHAIETVDIALLSQFILHFVSK